MMNRVGRLVVGTVAAVSMLIWLGCGQPGSNKPPKAVETDADHHHDHDHAHGDHDDHGETFADEFQELEEARVQIKDAFASGNPDKAHEAVHQAGHSLEELKEMAKADSVPADKQDELVKTVDDLFECFMAIDDKLEGREGKTYDEVAERIDAGMAKLKSEADRQEKK